MNRSGMKCVLYPRVSTEMQVDGFSLDGQRSSLKRFCTAWSRKTLLKKCGKV